MPKQNHYYSLKEALQPILRVINDLGGSVSFMDEEGHRFVISRDRSEPERQLPLPTAPKRSADEVLENINREIALYQIMQQEAAVDDLAVDDLPARQTGVPFTPAAPLPMREPLRVRFEPLRGDLPPELQE